MSDAGPDLEAVLHATFVQEAECYAQALRLAGELAEACGRGEPIDDGLRPVLALLDEVAGHEARIFSVKQHWEQAGRRAGVELRAVMDRIAALIRELGRQLHRIEEAARERRDRLGAELDVCDRRRRMQRAYLRES
jgi:hypothetical protein